MQKSDIKIMVLEDDSTLGKALEEALRRAGYSVHLARNYQQAQSAFKLHEFRGLVADCMIPQKGGVDIAMEFAAESTREPVIILTSGVFRDRGFVHESMLKVKARAFLTKPFDLTELVGHFDDAFRELLDAQQEPIFQLLERGQCSAKDRILAVNNSEFVHGFDLPYVFSLLSDGNISGRLTVEYSPENIAQVEFSNGQICSVRYDDKDSYFGVLLVERGFTTPEELFEGLKMKTNKPIGARLIDLSSVSPHAIKIVQADQMLIRLSKMIQETSVRVHFDEMPIADANVTIDGISFSQNLSDWIVSKLPADWLQAFYRPWLDSALLSGPERGRLNMLKGLPATEAFFELFPNMFSPIPLSELLAQHSDREDELLRGIHFLVLQRVLIFSERNAESTSAETKLRRFEKIAESMKTQDFFQILGVSHHAKPSEVHRAYHDLAKSLHPDKLPARSPEDLKRIAHDVFAKVSEAYQTLSNDERRQKYKRTLEMGVADEVLKAESIFEEGLQLLKIKQFREARKAFEHALKMRGKRSDLILYYVWAYIKEKRKKKDRLELSMKTGELLSRVPHEFRHSPLYFFVKGMHFELTGQIEKAYNHLKHSTTLDPYFQDARREMLYIKAHYAKNSKTSSFTDDLSIAVTKLFGKRKSG